MKQCSANTGKGKKDPENAEGLPYRSGMYRHPNNYAHNQLSHANSHIHGEKYTQNKPDRRGQAATMVAAENEKQILGPALPKGPLPGKK